MKPGTYLGTATAAKSGGQVTADIDGAVRTVEVARDLTVASGDVLLVHRVGSLWVACCRLFTAAPAAVDNDGVPDPQPGFVTGTTVVAPVETRSYRAGAGWRTDHTDVMQGEHAGGNHTGAAFYGSAPAALSGATVIDARVQVRRDAGDAAAPASTLRLVTETTRPSGAPTLTSSSAGPALRVGQSGEFTLPVAWVQAMIDGTAGGLAVDDADGSPYLRFAGRDSWAPAFTMTIDWSRPV